jgi:hypothetical protein
MCLDSELTLFFSLYFGHVSSFLTTHILKKYTLHHKISPCMHTLICTLNGNIHKPVLTLTLLEAFSYSLLYSISFSSTVLHSILLYFVFPPLEVVC